MPHVVFQTLRAFSVIVAFSILHFAKASSVEATPAGVLLSHVWAGHPVGFSFREQGGQLFVAFYDAERRLTVGQRAVAGGEWQMSQPEGVRNEAHKRMSNVVGWDSHNSIVMAFDRDGYVHLSGNMHVDPLVYYRSKRPLDITTLERVDRMTGDREGRCTYPVFFKNGAGDLFFRYRDGSSGNGSDIYNQYDVASRSWRHLLDTPLHDGEGKRNAYGLDPILGPDGRFHVLWMWRNTPDAATNHTLSYVRSADLVHWEDAHGRAVGLPITLGKGDIVDPAQPGGGLINTTFTLGFDREHRPIVVYHRYDEMGNSQIFAAKPVASGWEKRGITDWKFRWPFGGTGSLQTEIYVRSPTTEPSGNLVLPVITRAAGTTRLRFDPDQLVGLETLPAEPGALPETLMRATALGAVVHTSTVTAKGKRLVFRWETLPSNRDHARTEIPPPSELRVFEFGNGGTAK